MQKNQEVPAMFADSPYITAIHTPKNPTLAIHNKINGSNLYHSNFLHSTNTRNTSNNKGNNRKIVRTMIMIIVVVIVIIVQKARHCSRGVETAMPAFLAAAA